MISSHYTDTEERDTEERDNNPEVDHDVATEQVMHSAETLEQRNERLTNNLRKIIQAPIYELPYVSLVLIFS